MSEVVQFSDYCSGCKGCANLIKVSNDTYLCTAMTWTDNTSVYPIENGIKTDGFNVCHGEEFVKRRVKRSGERNSI